VYAKRLDCRGLSTAFSRKSIPSNPATILDTPLANGRDAFHRVPFSTQDLRDAVERVPTPRKVRLMKNEQRPGSELAGLDCVIGFIIAGQAEA